MNNRELHFRAYDKKFDVMIPAVGVYNKENIIVGDTVLYEAYPEEILDARLELIEDAGPEHFCITGDIEIMQEIGLQDEGGRELYEGDICVKAISPDENNLAPRELYRGVIVYHYGSFCLLVDNDYYPMSRQHGVITVVGNIYENPKELNEPNFI